MKKINGLKIANVITIIGVVCLGVSSHEYIKQNKQLKKENLHQETVIKKQEKELTYNVKNLDLQSGNIIKTKKFTLEYYDDNQKDFHIVLYPNDKNLRVVSEQGQGAKGVEIESVPSDFKGTTTIIQ
ncbi:hypothetical protein [Ligilactobacillus salivarius]|uniref:Putative membrane protein n=1 Tax=Ligilactobacillus salivarius TaxID=1624 RepID=A0A089QFV3_9LACO|nr:hypothetical protein [Ligilactobacillus salivarius]AIR11635.1 putative membrane protein [Ligilactobacillus salivarius]